MIERLIARLRRRWRGRRMALFTRILLRPEAGRILDVGGTPEFWNGVEPRSRITLLNLPGTLREGMAADPAAHPVIHADICALPRLPAGYGIVFSNSVLEHVGSARRQRLFAALVRQSPAYWVQVPAPTFPIEVHCRVPFWWALPLKARYRMIRRWRRAGDLRLARQMAGTRPISRRMLQALFPDARIITERFLGLAKSYYAFRTPG